MPAYNAGTVVEPLEFTFEPFVKDQTGWIQGFIKEPSDRQITQFLAAIKKIIKDAKGELPAAVEAGDTGALLDAMDDLDPAVMEHQMEKMAGAYAELCSGFPSAVHILTLPLRQRQFFFSWLQQEVMAPEAAPGGGDGALTIVPRAAAG